MYNNSNNIVYEIILQLIKGSNHVRGIAEQAAMPVSSIQNHLIKLIKSNVLDYNFIGKNKTYHLKQNIISKKYIINAENYKLLKIISKQPFLAEIFEEILKKTDKEIVILFGSYAKEISKETSDIDIYIETGNKNLKKDVEFLNSKINVKIGRFDKESLLIKEIIKNHAIIRGVEDYYEMLKK